MPYDRSAAHKASENRKRREAFPATFVSADKKCEVTFVSRGPIAQCSCGCAYEYDEVANDRLNWTLKRL